MRAGLRAIDGADHLNHVCAYLGPGDLNIIVDINQHQKMVAAQCEQILEQARQQAEEIRVNARLKAYQDTIEMIAESVEQGEHFRMLVQETLSATVMQMVKDSIEEFRLDLPLLNKLSFSINELSKVQSARFASRWLVNPNSEEQFRQAVTQSELPTALGAIEVVPTTEIGEAELALDFPGGARISVNAEEFIDALIKKCEGWKND